MQGKPIEGFEEDYYITENGDIIDLETGKLKTYYVRGNEIKPRVDLYKEGVLELSMYVEDIMLIHFFGKCNKIYYTINYKDCDVTNLSLSNLEILSNDNYVTTQQIKKPKKIYELTINGPVVVNQSEIDEVIRINHQNSLEREMERNKNRIRNYQKKLPAKGTPEYEERRLKLLEDEFLKSKVKQLEEMALRDGVKCTITYKNLKKRLKDWNYCCEISRVPLTFERKKDNTMTIKRIGDRFKEDITLDTINILAKRVFY